MNYFENAMHKSLTENPESRFWVFSDDFDFIRQELSPGLLSNCRFIEDQPDNAAAHLELMRHGYSYVLSNSTFSWWGAFLSYSSSPLVMCPNDWFATKSNPSLLIPDNWIRVDTKEIE
jgi:hypothetical protein